MVYDYMLMRKCSHTYLSCCAFIPCPNAGVTMKSRSRSRTSLNYPVESCMNFTVLRYEPVNDIHDNDICTIECK